MDDMAMKMQEPELAFVDGLYAKFYSLVASYCVWDPSAVAPLQDLIPSHPAEAVAGKRESSQCPASDCGLLIVPAPRAA
jgi:hypothetical protein